MPERPDHPLEEAAIAGPGSIAARQAGGAPAGQPRAGQPSVGTPGASDQANPAPAADGLSGQLTNDQMPGGGSTSSADRTPPDMLETPDPAP